MHNPPQQVNVEKLGVALAFLVPLAMAALVAFLAAQAGPHGVVLAGVPRDELRGLEVVSKSEATVSADVAVATARANARGGSNPAVRQVALGRYSDSAVEYLRRRTVWVINLNPDDFPVVIIGDFGADHSCDWALHSGYALTAVDARTGELVFTAVGGAVIDTSRPQFPVSDEQRAQCERLQREEQAAARPP